MNFKKTLIASGVALSLGAPAAHAVLVTDLYGANTWATNSANFTMLDGVGISGTGGTNDVNMSWDGNGYNNSTDYTGPTSAANITAASTTLFKNYLWTAHNIQVFTPGSYSFDTTLGGGAAEVGNLNVTVPVGQLGMHMLFDWNGNLNIDVFVVAAGSSVYGAGIGRSAGGVTPTSSLFKCDVNVKNCLYDGKGFGTDGKPAGNKIWMLATVDGNADTVMGIPMVAGGPFAGFNAGFNATMTPTPKVIPVPAAVWLFGSGLLGLVGISRRKNST